MAWDATTFAAWFSEHGFEVVREQRKLRSPAELAAIESFPDKLRALDPEELRIGALEGYRFVGRPEGAAASQEGGRGRRRPRRSATPPCAS